VGWAVALVALWSGFLGGALVQSNSANENPLERVRVFHSQAFEDENRAYTDKGTFIVRWPLEAGTYRCERDKQWGLDRLLDCAQR
jgi:hypothetical protein